MTVRRIKDLPADPQDPAMVRANVLACSRLTGSRRNRDQEVKTMHSYTIELLARQHETELRRSAGRHGLHGPGRRWGRRRSVRHRAGWALVAIGRVLAAGSGAA